MRRLNGKIESWPVISTKRRFESSDYVLYNIVVLHTKSNVLMNIIIDMEDEKVIQRKRQN
jgi:hypothetical protein